MLIIFLRIDLHTILKKTFSKYEKRKTDSTLCLNDGKQKEVLYRLVSKAENEEWYELQQHFNKLWNRKTALFIRKDTFLYFCEYSAVTTMICLAHLEL